MDLNYHHLLYFWMAAREGSVTKACEQLHLSQPTLSTQIRKLEKSIGADLFDRAGRALVLTDIGQVVFRYADEIFTLGKEMEDVVKGRRSQRGFRLVVGVPDALPKLVVYSLLKPALEMDEGIQLVTYEGKQEQLLTDLAMHRLDIMISDSPLTPATHVRAFNHLLGECGVSFFAAAKLSRKYRRGFPDSLGGAPMLFPTTNTQLRRGLDQWFDEIGVHPELLHEFEDSALLKVFGQAGEGIFACPSAIEKEVCRQYQVRVLGRTDAVKERFYAISVERRLRHPAVIVISQAARENLLEVADG